MGEGAGTFGQIIQGGSFAVLVAIGAWLMYWTPRRMAAADAREEAERKTRERVAEEGRKAIEALLAANDARHRDDLSVFAADQRYEREQCAQQFAVLVEGHQEHAQILARIEALLGRNERQRRGQ